MPDQKISALPLATLPLVGTEPTAVVQSGQTRQCPASAFASAATYVCTSVTRPASPYVGQQIYETDTGRSLVFQSVTTGWTPPWDTMWGEWVYTPITSNPPDVSTTETTLIQSGAVTIPANRITLVRFRCSSVQPITHSTNVKIYVTDASNTHLAMICREALDATLDDLGQAKTRPMDFQARLVGVSGSFQPKIRAVWADAATAVRFNAGPVDPGPISIHVLDAGPSGAPA